MFAYIKGTLISAADSVAVIESFGIGYELLVSQNTIIKLPPIGKEVKLFTFLSVKEDGVSIMGFHSQEEKTMFLKLTTVNGIGPKAAMSILSGMDIPSLALAVISGDAKAIAKVKGIGLKTAERIILELREKVEKDSLDTAFASVSANIKGENPTVKDAIEALCTLGITKQEAYKAVTAVAEAGDKLESLITKALKRL